MGCISSKPSAREQQPDNSVLIKHAPPDHHLLALVTPSKTKHTVIDDALELTASSKHDIFTLPPNNNHHTVDVIERCASFHTVEEYDELLQRISSHTNDDSELLTVPVQDSSDSACKKDSSDDDTGNETVNMEFQTVASLRQWLDSSGKNKGGAGIYAANDYPNPRTGFAFYQDNTSIKNTATSLQVQNSALVEADKQHEDESIEELVAAFDKYMQQLQIDEDNILKQISNTECAC